MTDRELLEKAAKAAGLRIHGWIGPKFYVVNGPNPADNYDPFQWNPLEDDGDAFRLMVELNIGLETYSTHVFASPAGNIDIEAMEWYEGDRLAATRRAIVRAAAAMGDAA
ncbi:hypothetical protein MHM84_03565 [Halomonas sp. McH1-25]|uniref:hypothetical protein n=1 Tax=unclassified Halomonas TaxID=2609666 RepID=UPI001EF5DC85|nr:MULTISPECIES: hypothetical protein [unclassified Halomonas]MCG7598850.1 hypothetical protein [Halomonas sp. McH1-25]MCP1340813.1 hypothetical protein [Halomonas sp. FL8]MCP1361304.1 hypothetical protein [Halomonas sp. BBD45]MCP1364335.1 hypothetical protein [Halomonas sp. BBD48]